MKKINWKYANEPVSETTIEDMEQKLGVKFPLDFIEIIKKYHGTSLEPNQFIYEDGLNGYFHSLLSFESDVDESFQELGLDTVKDDEFPDKVVPFGLDAAGNLLCFDYRQNEHRPTVVYWYHEEDEIYYVCDTFTELLDKLYDDEDEV